MPHLKDILPEKRAGQGSRSIQRWSRRPVFRTLRCLTRIRRKLSLAMSMALSIAFQHSCHADDDFFESKVRPVLVKRCYACHAGAKSGGGLSLETLAGWKQGGDSGTAIVPGNPDESLLINAINYRSLEMPPADKGGKLPQDEIDVLTKWVASGAADPRVGSNVIGGMDQEQAQSWWAFQPLPDADQIGKPTARRIDEFLQAEINARGLDVSVPANGQTLLRRATYDLTGLPPTSAEVDEFLADRSENAFDKVVDRLLQSPQYGVRWGRHWLDVVRYADTAGENTDRPLPHAWRYRNWVIDAMNHDLPYDEFVRQQICGDVISKYSGEDERAAGIIATGYLAIARRFGHDINKDMHLTYEDVIDNLGKNFLGLTLGCARCHDHKYDPIDAADYYALYGIFASTRFAFPGCEPIGQPRDLVPLIDPSEVASQTADYQSRLERYEQRLQQAAKGSQRLRSLSSDTTSVLAESMVGEGQSVVLQAASVGELDRIRFRKGEVLQLTVSPNANHGADTTQVELEITELGQPSTVWNVSSLIDRFAASDRSVFEDKGATWCLLDVTDGPQFLNEKTLNLVGQSALVSWARGDTPSSVVNVSMDPVSVWTTLPGRSLFIHPGVQRNVAVAWVCPADGEYQIRGVVTDAHPAGLDGITFRLEQIASASYGQGLLELDGVGISNEASRPEPPDFPVAYAVAESDASNARLHQRGDPGQLGEEIPRRWLSVFGGDSLATADGSGRRELAEHVVDSPLFARVFVNRIWQNHFGHGLVATPNDFGARGSAPTHPELLDWLAAQFRAGGYRIKPIHRLIMRTNAYQRSSVVAPALAHHDPQNLWLSHFSRRRLTAEEIRDSLLIASDQIDLTLAQAHPFPPESAWTFTQHNPFNAVYDTNRRSLFLMVQRQRRHPYLALFDGADPNSSTAKRQSTTVPTQALFFLNDPFVHDQANAFAQRIETQVDDAEAIRLAFRLLFQRDPTTNETDAGQEFLSKYPGDRLGKLSAYSRVLMSSNEYLYVD